MGALDKPFIGISDCIQNGAIWHPEKTAAVCGDRRLNYRDFVGGINRVANGLLKLGLKKGEKVSVYMGNSIDAVQVIFGIVAAGGVAVPLSTMVPPDVLEMMISDSDSVAIFVESEFLYHVVTTFREKLSGIRKDGYFLLGFQAEGWTDYSTWIESQSDEAPEMILTPDDEFNIIYSSGTTGVPKGIVHTHYSRFNFTVGLALGFRITPFTRSLLTTPIYTNGTWMMLLPTLTSGGSIVIMPNFDMKLFLELVEGEKCTHTFMVPTQFILIMAHPEFGNYDLSSMEIALSAGAPLRGETKREIIEKFKVQLSELYGLTEGIGTILMPEEMEGKTGSVGRPGLGTQLVIVDDEGNEVPRGQSGEIVGYGNSLMKGYYKKPEKTEECIWIDKKGRTFLRTGDMGKLDQDGYLYILDRKKDMIVSGGINIYASDLENLIAQHPAVKDNTVIAIPHEKWGETPLGLVVLHEGANVSEDEIREWANQRLGKYQRLAQVEFRDELPRNVLGKVLKRQLREPYWENG